MATATVNQNGQSTKAKKDPYVTTPPGQKHQCDNSHPECVALVKRMGSKRGYSPIPPDQHHWQSFAGEPPLYRIWAWLCDHTLAWGHRCEYAVDKNGNELHLEHIAAELDMDIANVYRYWDEGAKRGIWRGGKKTEGERRLFLCGSVAEPATEEAKKKVCADNFPLHIWKQIKDWPPEERDQFKAELERVDEEYKQALSAVTAGLRHIRAQKEDSVCDRRGVKNNRQEHKKDGESDEEAAARRARFEPILPALEQYVQTIATPHTVENETLHKTENGSAQSQTDDATLLPVSPISGGEDKAGSSLLDTGARGSAAKPFQQGKKSKYLPADELPDFKSAETVGTEWKAAYDLLFSEIKRMQDSFPHQDFSSERLDPKDRSHQILIARILKALTPQFVLPFLVHCGAKFRGIGKGGLGKLPPRAPGSPNGPRKVGLLLEWAISFGRQNGVQQWGDHAEATNA